jgi:hypothetical protein
VISDAQIEDIRQDCQSRVAACGFDVSLVWFAVCQGTVESLTIEYQNDLTFEMLERLSVEFGTRKIEVGCDQGTGSDRSHDPYVLVREPTKLMGARA